MRDKVFVVASRLRAIGFVLASVAVGACAAIADIRQPPGLEDYEPSAFLSLTVPTEQAFAPIHCGAASASGTVPLRNDGTKPLTYELDLRPNATFGLHGAPATLKGTIPAQSSTNITVDVTASLPGTQTATLLVKVDGKAKAVPLKVDVVGAVLSITPSFVDFGEFRETDRSAKVTVLFRNDGNEDLSVSNFAGGAAFALSAATLPVSKGQSAPVDVSLNFGSVSAAPTSVDVPLQFGAVCGPPPKLTLRGQHVDTTTLVSPLSIDLGDFACAADSAGRSAITISNDSTTDAASYVATLAPDSRFTLVGNAMGQVPMKVGDAMGTATFQVGAKPGPLPLAATDPEQLKLDVTIAGVTTTRMVRLHMAGYGGAITAPTDAVAPIHLGDTAYVGIKNTGNARVCVQYTSSASGFEVPQLTALNPQDENVFGVKFTGPARAEGTTSNIAFTQVECGDVPGLLLNGRLCGSPPAIPVQGVP